MHFFPLQSFSAAIKMYLICVMSTQEENQKMRDVFSVDVFYKLLIPVSSGGGLVLEIKVLGRRFFSFLSLGRTGSPEDFNNHTFPCALLHLFCLTCI